MKRVYIPARPMGARLCGQKANQKGAMSDSCPIGIPGSAAL